MWMGRSQNRQDKNPATVAHTIMTKGSCYEIVDPLVWHAVVPMKTTWTIMLNQPAWALDVAHESILTTAGKDLDKMPEDDLVDHLYNFKELVGDYLK